MVATPQPHHSGALPAAPPADLSLPPPAVRAGAAARIFQKLGRHLRHPINRFVARYSLVPNDPRLAVEHFDWAPGLEARWRDILAEVERTLPKSLPAIADLAPDHHGINPDHRWKSVFLLGYGHRMSPLVARFPVTWAAIRDIPGLFSAIISVHEPGTHLKRHRGVTKGMITVHLPLRVPRHATERCRIDVDGAIHVWRDGELFIFDDTYEHEAWNDSDELRIILLLHVLRPLHGLGGTVQRLFFRALQRSQFVREARRNVLAWSATVASNDI